jgi:ADP-ribose pyrophosphatase YjhB (NUDIX family)
MEQIKKIILLILTILLLHSKILPRGAFILAYAQNPTDKKYYFLLGKNPNEEKNRFWELCGGTIEEEESEEFAAAREFNEETLNVYGRIFHKKYLDTKDGQDIKQIHSTSTKKAVEEAEKDYPINEESGYYKKKEVRVNYNNTVYNHFKERTNKEFLRYKDSVIFFMQFPFVKSEYLVAKKEKLDEILQEEDKSIWEEPFNAEFSDFKWVKATSLYDGIKKTKIQNNAENCYVEKLKITPFIAKIIIKNFDKFKQILSPLMKQKAEESYYSKIINWIKKKINKLLKK